MKCSTKLYDTTHLTLGMLLHYLGKLEIQIFCRYSADIEENANKLHLYTDYNSSTRVTVYAKCIYALTEKFEILSIRRHGYFLFTARSAAAWLPGCLSTVPVSCNFFNSLLTPRFVQLCSGNSPVNLFAVYHLQIKTFYQNLVLVAEYHVDC